MNENTRSAEMTLASVRRRLIARLKEAGLENTTGEADQMLVSLLNCTRAAVLAHPERQLPPDRIAVIEEAVCRRILGEPLQYILKESFFFGRSFEVSPGVLIPRPETELLAEMALSYLPVDEPRAFLDWGTGSGCIAITLLLERPAARAVMAEKNPRSVRQAWRNLTRYGLNSRAFLRHSQNPEDIAVTPGSLDLVVSNPPYIPTREIEGLMREVRDHEPHLALDGGEDGLDCCRLLLSYASVWLKPGGILMMETGGQVQIEALRRTGTLTFLNQAPDLAGIPRIATWMAQHSNQAARSGG